MSGTTRACRGRTSDTIEFAFPFFRDERDQKRERRAHLTARLRTRLRFSSDFASPPGKSFSPIEIRKHAKERKKERTNDTRYIIVLMNDVYICRLRECIIARAVLSVSRSSSSRDASTQRTTSFKFHFTTTKKKKVKRNERGAKRKRFFEQRAQYKRTVCGVRCSNNERVVSSIRRRERECVHGGCKWFKTFVRFEKNVFFKSQT